MLWSPRHLSPTSAPAITNKAGRWPLYEWDLFFYAKTSAGLRRPTSPRPLGSASPASRLSASDPEGVAGLQPT